MMQLDKYQQKVLDTYRTTNKNIFVNATAGCLGKDVPVLMFDGSMKMSQDIVVGDVLMGPDSTPRNVLVTQRGHSNMYRIVPVKGMEWTCNDSHVMVVHDQYITRSMRLYNSHHKTDVVDRRMDSILKFRRSDNSIGHLKLVRTGVEFSEVNTKVDPYILGLWLAEGTKKKKAPTFTIYKEDTDILEYLRNYSVPTGVFIKEKPDGESCIRVKFLGANHEFNDEFSKSCVDGAGMVSIPKNYLINSRKNRLRLLAGLLDGDGYLGEDGKGFTISTKFEQLGKDIVYLCRSLGFQCNGHWKKSTIRSRNFEGYYYHISISGHTDAIPNVLKRKHAGKRQQIKDVLHTGFSVYDIGMGDWYGFTVDGDNRYLLGDFTITHNSGKTTTLVQLANATPPAKKAIFLAFNKSIANELSSRLPNTVKASTLHSCGLSAFLKAYRCDMTVNDTKYFRIAKDSLDWKGVHPKRIPGLCAKICRIYDLMRFNLVPPAVPDIMALAERYGEDINEDIANRAIQLYVMDSRTMEQYLNGGCKGRLVMDYTDMLYYTVKYLEDSDMKHYNVVMLDESQDISPLQYSLVKKLRTPHGRTVAVGDAKQSIYSFMGSNLDSLHEIQNAPNTVTLPLSVTYRCAMDIVDEAAKVFPGEIFAAPNAAKGSVTYGEFTNAANGDYIVCRNNAPLVEVFLKLIKKGKKCTILGKELGEQLVEMIDSVSSIYDFEKILDNVIKKLSSKGVDNPIKTEIYAKMDERVTILLDLYDYFGDLNTVRNRIHDIFVADADNTGITLSTIHKSKGLEARNVYFLCPELLPSKFARTELELYAEKCLQFVGITRAKENLIYCTK